MELTGRNPETNSLPDAVEYKNAETGRLNPDWVERLMGWQEGWTDLAPLTEIKNDLTKWGGDWEGNCPRVTNKSLARADRLTAIGNGQVPICAATAFTILRNRT